MAQPIVEAHPPFRIAQQYGLPPEWIEVLRDVAAQELATLADEDITPHP